MKFSGLIYEPLLTQYTEFQGQEVLGYQSVACLILPNIFEFFSFCENFEPLYLWTGAHQLFQIFAVISNIVELHFCKDTFTLKKLKKSFQVYNSVAYCQCMTRYIKKPKRPV